MARVFSEARCTTEYVYLFDMIFQLSENIFIIALNNGQIALHFVVRYDIGV